MKLFIYLLNVKQVSVTVKRNANTSGKLEQIQARVLQDAPRAGLSNPGHDRVMYPLHLLCHMHLLLSIRRFFLITGTKYKYKNRQKTKYKIQINKLTPQLLDIYAFPDPYSPSFLPYSPSISLPFCQPPPQSIRPPIKLWESAQCRFLRWECSLLLRWSGHSISRKGRNPNAMHKLDGEEKD